jgi:hypothetical protein
MTSLSERDVLASTAALLDQGERIDRISRALTVTALATLAAFGVFDVNKPAAAVLLASSVLTGLAASYLAIRVGFDAAVFRRMAEAPEAPDFSKLDGALTMLGLLAAGRTGRPLGQRTNGACRLFRCLAGLAVAQVILFLLGAVLAMPH